MEEPLFSESELTTLLSTSPYDPALLSLLEQRVSFIVNSISKLLKTSCSWYWGPDIPLEDQIPVFTSSATSIKEQLLFILVQPTRYTSHCHVTYNGIEYDLLASGIPLEWLWTPNLSELLSSSWSISKTKSKDTILAKRKHTAFLKQAKKEYIISAKKKLTPEEKWAIGLSRKLPSSLK
jgi:hypothetical protein